MAEASASGSSSTCHAEPCTAASGSAHMVPMHKGTAHLELAQASIAQHVSHLETSHGSSSGVIDMITRWVAHAAVWRIIDHLALPVVIAVGVAAVVFMIARSRRRSRARD